MPLSAKSRAPKTSGPTILAAALGLWTSLHYHDARAMRVRVTAVTHIDAPTSTVVTP